ncbi:MAG TPA: ECF-type sigma factor [Gemmataceae bacterium]|nr:ECF-type sigma factor [Gemmataceae bacterium]
MTEVTRILSAIEQGDPHAAEQLLPLVYDELRKLAAAKMAQETPGQTLQTTALVHEAYLRLVDKDEVQQWNSRGHFIAAAAEAMRRILVERARLKRRLRHGGGRRRVNFDKLHLADETSANDFLDLDGALTQLAHYIADHLVNGAPSCGRIPGSVPCLLRRAKSASVRASRGASCMLACGWRAWKIAACHRPSRS